MLVAPCTTSKRLITEVDVLGTAFAIFGALAGFGLANTVQSNSVANVLESTFAIPVEFTAVVITVLVASVILGGIETHCSGGG